MRPTPRPIASILAAIGFAVSAMIGAPVAVASNCIDGKVWLNGECIYPPDASGGPPPQPKLTTVSGPPRNATMGAPGS